MSEPPIDTQVPIRLDLRAEAIANEAFLHVIRTGRHLQVAVMAIPPYGEIGAEVRPESDQLFVIVDGTGEAHVGNLVLGVWPGDVVFVEGGTRHNIVNRGAAPLRLVAAGAPAINGPGAIRRTRANSAGAAAPSGADTDGGRGRRRVIGQ